MDSPFWCFLWLQGAFRDSSEKKTLDEVLNVAISGVYAAQLSPVEILVEGYREGQTPAGLLVRDRPKGFHVLPRSD